MSRVEVDRPEPRLDVKWAEVVEEEAVAAERAVAVVHGMSSLSAIHHVLCSHLSVMLNYVFVTEWEVLVVVWHEWDEEVQ